MQIKSVAVIVSATLIAALVYILSSFEQKLLAAIQSSIPLPPHLTVITANMAIVGLTAGLITRNFLYGGIAAAVGGAVGQLAAISAGVNIISLTPQLPALQSRMLVVVLMFLAGALTGLIFSRLTPVEAEAPEIEEQKEPLEEVFKICRFCNEKIPDEAIFCPFCGRKLVEENLGKEVLIIDEA